MAFARWGQALALSLSLQWFAKALAIGVYPATGLKEARVARDEAKRLLIAGQDSTLARQDCKGDGFGQHL